MSNNNHKKKDKFSVSLAFFLIIVVLMVSGSVATISVYAVTTQTVPTCVDPTGHNLPCMIVISTLPPPPNPLQCQESSGQIIACSYTTHNLSNGEQIVVITVYVPANFVFSSPAVIKVIVHEATTTSTTGGGTGGGKTILHKLLVAIGIAKDPIVRGNIQTISVTISNSKVLSAKIAGADVNGEVTYVTGHPEPLNGVTDDQGIYSHHWRISGDAIPGKFKVDVHASANGKTGSATTTFTVIPKINTTSLANATIPINVTNPTLSNLTTSPTGTNGTTGGNYSAGPASGGPTGKGGGSNGTQATQGQQLLPQLQPPAVDCNANPSDPSCTQQPPPTTTQTCPDGSQPDSNGKCPNTPQQPPSSNNPTPPSGDHHDHHGSKPKKSTNGGEGETSPTSPSSPPQP